jgi:peptidoglycan hydrolase CwlO-like protein
MFLGSIWSSASSIGKIIFSIWRGALKEIIFSLQKVKEEAQKEFEKVDGQVEYHLMLISSKQAKLVQLVKKLEVLVKKVEDL